MAESKDQPDAVTKEATLVLRLKAAKSAQERTRLAFLTVTLISFAMLTAGWNAHYSLYRDVAKEFADSGKTDPKRVEHPNVYELQQDFLREFVANRMINIQLIGIRVGVDDAPILGAVALIVALLWFYQSVRRENYVIGWLLHDSRNDEKETKLRIFHGIISYSVFIRVLPIDQPFSSLDYPRGKATRGLQFTIAHLYFLPIFAFLLVLGLEVVALLSPSPFRPSDDSLYCFLSMHHREDLDRRLFHFKIAIGLALVIWFLCRKIYQFEKGTTQALRDFFKPINPFPAIS